MNTHLPTTVRFPGGYTITIKTIAPSTLKRQSRDECFGYWDGATRTIYIDKTASERKQRYTLTHEMIHGFADWQHVYLKEDQAE